MLNAYKMRTMRTHSINVSEGFTIRDAPKSITGLVTSRIAILGAAFRSVDGDLVSVIMVFVFVFIVYWFTCRKRNIVPMTRR